MRPVPFVEAIAFAKERKAQLPDSYYGARIGLARTLGFTVSGLSQVAQVQGILDHLNVSLKSGESFQSWKKRVAAGEVPLTLPAWRKELIYRNFVQTAYARGRCAKQATVRDRRPYLMYDAVNDSRTRPSHAAMDGRIYRYDHPVWQTWTPQNGHACRCKTIALTEKEAKAMGGVSAGLPTVNGEEVAPDKGWEYSPCANPAMGLQQAIDRTSPMIPPQFREHMERIAPKAPPELDEIITAGDDALKRIGTNPETMVDNLKRILADERGAGSVQPVFYTRSSQARGLVNEAAAIFPASWVKSGNSLGRMIVWDTKFDRGEYGFEVGAMTGHLYLTGSLESAIHEYSHWLQTAMPDLDDYFQRLHVARTAGDKHERLYDLLGDRFGKSERTRKDRYIHPYMGKESDLDVVPYPTRARAMEVMPTAIQLFLAGGQKWVEAYLQKDPELLKLILGTLLKYEP